MTKDEIKRVLDDMGVEYGKDAKLAELETLYASHATESQTHADKAETAAENGSPQAWDGSDDGEQSEEIGHDRTVVSATHGLFQPALPMRGVTAILCANLLLRSTYSVIRQTRYTQQARQASLCHTIWCEPHVCHMRASCSHHGPTMPRTLQLRTLASHLHAQSSSHICFQDCRIANYLSPDRSARRARS